MKKVAIGGMVLVVALIGLMTALNVKAGPAPTGEVVAGVQEVTLRMQGGTYLTEPATLEPGKRVRMTVDLDTVQGCMRDIVIPEFDVRKLVSEGDNVIEFTPTSGSHGISCSMGMGQGTLLVGESVEQPVQAGAATPTAAPTVEKASCGSGGCGCH